MDLSPPQAAASAPLNRLHPATRLAAAAALAAGAALLHRPQAAALALAGGLSLLPLCGLPAGLLLRRMAAGAGFLAFLWLALPLTAPGPAAWSLGPLALSGRGLELAALATLKGLAVLAAFLALAAALPVAALGRGLRRLGVPAGLSALLAFTYRYLFVLAEEYRRLRLAATVRGFVPGTNLHTYRTFANLLGMVLVRSLERAERVRLAMLCRGFDGTFRLLDERVFGPADGLALAATALFLAALAALEAA